MTQNTVTEASNHAALEQSAHAVLPAADRPVLVVAGEALAEPDIDFGAFADDAAFPSTVFFEDDNVGGNEGVMRSSTDDARYSLPSARAAAGRSASFRSTSGKIASLRAAFEKSAAVDSAARRRFPSAERKASPGMGGGVEVTTDREREYWREISRLRGERDTELQLRQSCEAKCQALEVDMACLRKRLESESLQNGGGEAATAGALNGLHVAKTRTTDRVGALQQQLSDLKKAISTATRMDDQVTDSTFAQGMGLLHHELQNWTVNNFRRVKVDVAPSELGEKLEGFVERTRADHLSQIYASFGPAARLAFYQATAVYFLMDAFDAPLLYGLPGEQDWCKHVLLAAENLEQQLTPTAFSKWRAATLESIQQSSHFEDRVQDAIERMTSTISTTLGTLTNTANPNVTGLLTFVRRAVALSHTFRLQRARYEVYLPFPGAAFDAAMMEDISDHSEAPLPQSTAASQIRCATFPAVVKIGDECGDNALLRNVILKAKVLCETHELEP
ncbi:hypothetical protein LTR08_004242 [Meristemomyces frigidus]|nr:hypothetical protein LTR08_004242 [Meristemomyces frigidus]